MCFAPQRRALFRHLNVQKWCETVSLDHFWLANVLLHNSLHFFGEVLREWCAFHILTWKRAWRHSSTLFWTSQRPNWLRGWSGMHFFNILSYSFQKCSEHGVFCTFGLVMCFAPQRRALLPHLNLRTWGGFNVLTSFKRASPHNGVQFLISQLPRWLRTRPL